MTEAGMMWRVLAFLSVALPAIAGFSKPVQNVQLAHGQNSVTLIFEADRPIRKAKAHCDCTRTRIESNRLLATVDTSKFDGKVAKTIDATTDDGRTTRLTMNFTVPAALVLSARTLQWKVGSAVKAQTLRMTIPKGSPIGTVTEAALSGEAFDYSPRLGKRPGEFSVIVTPKSTAQRVLNRLIVETDSKDPRFARYIIYLRVK